MSKAKAKAKATTATTLTLAEKLAIGQRVKQLTATALRINLKVFDYGDAGKAGKCNRVLQKVHRRVRILRAKLGKIESTHGRKGAAK